MVARLRKTLSHWCTYCMCPHYISLDPCPNLPMPRHTLQSLFPLTLATVKAFTLMAWALTQVGLPGVLPFYHQFECPWACKKICCRRSFECSRHISGQAWVNAVFHVKGWHACGCVCVTVNGKLSSREEVSPRAAVRDKLCMQFFNACEVVTFSETICLWVIHCWHEKFGTCKLMEFAPKSLVKQLSWSETMAIGKPLWLTILSKKIVAVSLWWGGC